MTIEFKITQEDLQDKDIAIAAKVLADKFFGAVFLTPETTKTDTKQAETVSKTPKNAPKQPETVSAGYMTAEFINAPAPEPTQTEMALPGVTLVQLREAATEYAKAHGPAAVKALLAKYDAPSVTAMKEEHYAAMLADLEVG